MTYSISCFIKGANSSFWFDLGIGYELSEALAYLAELLQADATESCSAEVVAYKVVREVDEKTILIHQSIGESNCGLLKMQECT